MEHIVAALFDVPSEAYQAFTELKGFPQNDETRIAQAVLLKKENGVISVADAFDPLRQVGSDMLTGTLVGSVLGILGGPLGMLFGAGVGAWVGSMGSSEEAMAQATLLETVATRLKNGDVAIIALAQERSETPLDQFFGRFKTWLPSRCRPICTNGCVPSCVPGAARSATRCSRSFASRSGRSLKI